MKNHGDVEGRVIDEKAVGFLAVLTQTFAVVTGENDNCVLV